MPQIGDWLAARRGRALIYVHVRDPGFPGIQEVINNAAATGVPLHIVHINSMALGHIESALFDEGWQSDLGGIGYGDLQWQDTGERLNPSSFEAYRAQGGVVIIHMMKAAWIDAGIGRHSIMTASDGMPYAPGAHPRSAGTFARVLGRYVRERQALDLMNAVAKMTLMPGDRLSMIAPGARLKGRAQVGADADITVFDPDRVIDRATFSSGLQFSERIEYVLVNGVPVVDKGETVRSVYPGRALTGRYAS